MKKVLIKRKQQEDPKNKRKLTYEDYHYKQLSEDELNELSDEDRVSYKLKQFFDPMENRKLREHEKDIMTPVPLNSEILKAKAKIKEIQTIKAKIKKKNNIIEP